MALKYYDEEEYYKAYPLFDELIPLFRGSEKSELLAYKFAWCDYNLKDFILAGYRFDQFVKTFPNSKYAEEAQFMLAMSYYKSSPVASLDQQETYKAIDEFQLYLDQYSSSTRADSAMHVLDELRKKLEFKAFENARIYHKTQYYKSAVIALNNFINDYPGTKYAEQAYFLIIDSNYQLALNSIYSKQKERYEATLKAYQKFVDKFPKSTLIKEAEEIYTAAQKELSKITSNSNS